MKGMPAPMLTMPTVRFSHCLTKDKPAPRAA